MSVASEFPPEVHIPERARRTSSGQRHLQAVPAPTALAGAGTRKMPTALLGKQAAGLRRAVRPTVSPKQLCRDEVHRSAAAPLRMTRRGIAVLVAASIIAAGLLLLLAHASLGLAPSSSAAAPAQGSSVAAGSVVVQDGDTLWSIAQRVRPTRDPRQVVDQLERVNHLHSATLSPGQTLKLG